VDDLCRDGLERARRREHAGARRQSGAP
jgi:hypothetical protein